MNIDKEREKRDFLIQNYSRLSKDLNSLIKTNLNIISSTLRSTFINKIKDWARKVVLLRVCDWINQIKGQIDKIISERLFLDIGGGSLSYNGPLPFISLLPLSDCPHKIKKLNLKEIDDEKLTNLFKTKFIYLKIIEKCCKNAQGDYGSLIDKNLILNNNLIDHCTIDANFIDDIDISDYFFTSKLDLKSGIIEFYGKEDKMQIIEPNLKLDDYPTINSHFKDPLTLKIGITSLKFFLFKSKIAIGLLFFKKLSEMRLCDLEKKTYSHEIEGNFVKFIRKDEILNVKFREFLYKEIENFFNFLFGLDCEDFKKFFNFEFDF